MAQTFGTWLKRQAHRDDHIGDLAQDFLSDLRRTGHGVPSQWTPHHLHQRLTYLDACTEAFDALSDAEAEWRSFP